MTAWIQTELLQRRMVQMAAVSTHWVSLNGTTNLNQAALRTMLEEHWRAIEWSMPDDKLEIAGRRGGGDYGGFYVWTAKTAASSVRLLAAAYGMQEESYDTIGTGRGIPVSNDTMILACAAGILRKTLFDSPETDRRRCILPEHCAVSDAIEAVGGSTVPSFLYQVFTGEYFDPGVYEDRTAADRNGEQGTKRRKEKGAEIGAAREAPSDCDQKQWHLALNQAQNLHKAATGRSNPKHTSLGVS
jgi:hypothetical protein